MKNLIHFFHLGGVERKISTQLQLFYAFHLNDEPIMREKNAIFDHYVIFLHFNNLLHSPILNENWKCNELREKKPAIFIKDPSSEATNAKCQATILIGLH